MTDPTVAKASLRKQLRAARRAHAASISENIRALLFKRPPAPLMELIPADAVVGLYHAGPDEAPASGYAKFFSEAGHKLALPTFASPDDPMQFAEHTDPFGETDLVEGAFGLKRPSDEAEKLTPDVIFAPLLGFTDTGDRLGQGGGHYDRWLAQNTETLTIGMAWDEQLVDNIPTEPHDIALSAIVTPTRLYGPF
ncbi:5-formyltetrahydrofolate cyclo-ligase [Pontixanthobacter aestiaquae]|uniref:5-formyltetrahydrofolate cyclo-ligase n=1 Tax=Pontixanthobacter aestiaquae TaxID=1509367 RepID=A0A844Z7W8_9SPHN|nr:5-formyltetrahydrofolate cyclo-ligase [Pontixanthobacter aestiaquae]MDN3645581.1 5-formyltetrahydrofolate cyclo-ligase [Pontixanthobacter aestiaquae]MXO83422.1 5-formyltetrahydrofolate cyclo-ligase [Pontixanthobacter aestiaquae]